MFKRNGLYIACDGCDGAGKTTMVKRLGEELADRGVAHRMVREPGGTPIGAKLREILLDPANAGSLDTVEDIMLMSSDRSLLMRTVVRPALEAGVVVVGDRTAASTDAYQITARRREDLRPLLDEINRQIAIWPDLLFLFDLDPQISIERSTRRAEGKTRFFDTETMEFHRLVREGFRRFAKHPPCPVHIIDASRSEEEVWKEIIGQVDKLITGVRTP